MILKTSSCPLIRELSCNLLIAAWLLSRNAAAGASIGDSLAEPRALVYASRTAYVGHA